MRSCFARHAWLPSGWATDVRIDIGVDGVIAAVVPHAERVGELIDRPVVPGLCDVHSHAFQRAMAGLAEGSRGTRPTDTFWTWRELMYACVARLSPDAMEDIATQLYIELLKGGYTSVCEFHYVHNAADGTPYANRAETSERIIAAAARAHIGLTLLPVLYMASNFGGRAPHEGQRRFISTPEALLRVLDEMRGKHDVVVGMAPHSLRAVPPEALNDALQGFARAGGGPLHIHAAEQIKEVDDCVAWSSQRPVEWLLDHHAVDAQWCIVHATHMTSRETMSLARTGAVAGLCPSTEGNLGDGVFNFVEYLASGGAYGIGSDSNVCTRAAEEMRLLEYVQRLTHRRRNLASDNTGSAGEALYRAALAGGARASGRPIGGIAAGQRADLVVLDAGHATLAARGVESVLDAYVFSAHGNLVRDVMVGGEWAIRDRRHADEETAARRYASAVRELA